MTRWANYGVCIADESVRGELLEAVRDAGLVILADKDAGIVMSKKSSLELEKRDVMDILQEYISGVSGLIYVSANDTSDTARGNVYAVNDGEFERVCSEYSGGDSGRYDWIGISYNGLQVDGGKYY
jgi:hypothetical protein